MALGPARQIPQDSAAWSVGAEYVSQYNEYQAITTPATPSLERGRVYVKELAGVSTLYFLDDNGVEHDLVNGGGGPPAPSTSQYLLMQNDVVNLPNSFSVGAADADVLLQGVTFHLPDTGGPNSFFVIGVDIGLSLADTVLGTFLTADFDNFSTTARLSLNYPDGMTNPVYFLVNGQGGVGTSLVLTTIATGFPFLNVNDQSGANNLSFFDPLSNTILNLTDTGTAGQFVVNLNAAASVMNFEDDGSGTLFSVSLNSGESIFVGDSAAFAEGIQLSPSSNMWIYGYDDPSATVISLSIGLLAPYPTTTIQVSNYTDVNNILLSANDSASVDAAIQVVALDVSGNVFITSIINSATAQSFVTLQNDTTIDAFTVSLNGGNSSMVLDETNNFYNLMVNGVATWSLRGDPGVTGTNLSVNLSDGLGGNLLFEADAGGNLFQVYFGSFSSYFTLDDAAGFTLDIGAGNALTLVNLPTADPTTSNRVWDNLGVLMKDAA